jgi:site-specific recombinase XerC
MTASGTQPSLTGVGIARRPGVPFRCHDLRHHFASTFLEATGDIAALQAILGHKTISMTMRYAHMITTHLHKAMSTFEAKRVTKTGTAGTYSAPAEIEPALIA